MSTSGCLLEQPSHSTYATFRAIRSTSTATFTATNTTDERSNEMTRSTSFISAEEEAQRMLLRAKQVQTMVPTSLSEHLLVQPPQVTSAPIAPAPHLAADSQRSLLSSSSGGYHSSSSVISRTNNRSDDVSPPPSSASSSSSSGCTSRQSNLENAEYYQSNLQSRTMPTALTAIDEELPPLQAHEVAQVDIFYRSLKTDVRVASSIAQLFVEDSNGNHEVTEQCAYGIPLWLVDKFPTASSSDDKRRKSSSAQPYSKQVLYLILAERGTGFTMRRERITQRDSYTLVPTSADTHRLTVWPTSNKSKNPTVYLLKFVNPTAAGQFFAAFNELTQGDNIFLPSNKKSNSSSPSNGFSMWWKGKLPSKLSLSRPCCFRHLTNLDSSYLALSQTAAIATTEHRKMSLPVSQVNDHRSSTMPRRTSLSSTGSVVAPSVSSHSSLSAAGASSTISPLAAAMPCRVSQTPNVD